MRRVDEESTRHHVRISRFGFRTFLAGWVLAAVCGSAASGVEPANRQSNPQVKTVLEYFYSLADKSENRIVSGQFTDFGNGANLKIMERVQEATGQWPALLGADYADFRRGSITTKVPNAAAIEYWKQGGLVSIMAHMYNPANPKGGGLRDKGVDIAEVLQEGTDTHQRWMQQLDLIADGLLELKAAGVVVLWRPFHEMNGGWFWWGAQKPESFIAVWRHMFDYFSKTKGLDNLIWVYGPNHGKQTAAYYAGDPYVDMLGLDAYTDFLDPEHVRGYDEIVALNKPFGFSEYGPHGSSNPPGDYDYLRFIDGVKKHFPKTCYFMCWNARWSLATNKNVKEMLSDPVVANRDELPKELSSSATTRVSGPPVEGDWRLTFEDTFEGDKLDSSKWIPSYQWGQTHNYNAYCDPNNVLVENGLLRLKVENKPSHGKKHTSAVITSHGKFSQKYGYFEGRFRIPMGKGFWPAFWMLPYPQHWPPEIDIFETIRDDPQIYMTYHWDDQGHKSSGKHWTEEGFSYSKEFHTYGLLWEPDKIVWYIDVTMNAIRSGCTRGIDSGVTQIVIDSCTGSIRCDRSRRVQVLSRPKCQYVQHSQMDRMRTLPVVAGSFGEEAELKEGTFVRSLPEKLFGLACHCHCSQNVANSESS